MLSVQTLITYVCRMLFILRLKDKYNYIEMILLCIPSHYLVYLSSLNVGIAMKTFKQGQSRNGSMDIMKRIVGGHVYARCSIDLL